MRVDPVNQLIVLSDSILWLADANVFHPDVALACVGSNGFAAAGKLFFPTEDPIIFPLIPESVRIAEFGGIRISFRIDGLGIDSLALSLAAMRRHCASYADIQ